MTQQSITEADEGKRVVDEAGDMIGTVAAVRDGRAYVEPDQVANDTLLSKLGWNATEEDTYLLDESDIEEIVEGEIRVRRG